MFLLNNKLKNLKYFFKRKKYLFSFDFFNYSSKHINKKININSFFLFNILFQNILISKLFLIKKYVKLLNFTYFFCKNNFFFFYWDLFIYFLSKCKIHEFYNIHNIYNNNKINLIFKKLYKYTFLDNFNYLKKYILSLKSTYMFLTYCLHIDLKYADAFVSKSHIRPLLILKKNQLKKNIYFSLRAKLKRRLHLRKIDSTLKGMLKRKRFTLAKSTHFFEIQYNLKYFEILNKKILNIHKKSVFLPYFYFPLINTFINYFFFKGDYYRLSLLFFQFKQFFNYNEDYINLYKLASNVKFKDSYNNLFYFVNKMNLNLNTLNFFPYDLYYWFLNHKNLSFKMHKFLWFKNVKMFFVFWSFFKKLKKDYRKKYFFKQKFSFIFRLSRKFRLKKLLKYRKFKINTKYLYFKTKKLLKWQKKKYTLITKPYSPKFLRNLHLFLRFLYKRVLYFKYFFLKKNSKMVIPDSFFIKFLKNNHKSKKTLSNFYINKNLKKFRVLKWIDYKKFSFPDKIDLDKKRRFFVTWIRSNYYTILKNGNFSFLHNFKHPGYFFNTTKFYNFFILSRNSFLFFYKNYLLKLRLSNLLLSKSLIFVKNSKLQKLNFKKQIHNFKLNYEFAFPFNLTALQKRFLFFFFYRRKKFGVKKGQIKKKKRTIIFLKNMYFSFYFFFLFSFFIQKFFLTRCYFYIERLYFWLYDKGVLLFRKLKNINIFFVALLNNLLFKQNALFLNRFSIIDTLFLNYFNSSFLDLNVWKLKKIFPFFYKKKYFTRYTKRWKKNWNKTLNAPKYCKIMRLIPYKFI